MKNHVINSLLLCSMLSILACEQANKATQDNQMDSDSTKSTAMEQIDKKSASPIIFERSKVQGEKDTLSFEVPRACAVHITLATETASSNIRINQLVKPDGQTDGPFGKTLTDSLTETGTYQLVIAESLMAENPYTGPYTLRIELK